MSGDTRLFLEGELTVGSDIALPAESVQHLRARRLRPGEKVVLFNGQGGEFHGTLRALERREAVVTLEAFDPREAESPLEIVLVQGIAKGERMDFTIQKGVELGVAAIQPVFTDHGVVRLDSKRAEKRRAHWQAVATSACEQCGRNRVPPVHSPTPLSDFWQDLSGKDGIGIVLDADGGHATTALQPAAKRLRLLVGPEGGLSDQELRKAAERGLTRLTLGPRILRTETAGLAAIAALQTLYGDLSQQDSVQRAHPGRPSDPD
jgi:16S rRNA (uracil1498-N3)-methyltransferase